jgi:8-amino-7-oxononanoate synthase
MQAPLLERLEQDLECRRRDGLFRSLLPACATPDAATINLSTNSYLCLHENPEVMRDSQHLAGNVLSGNLASRLVSDTSPLAKELECELASWKQTAVFCDRHNHASIIDGIRLAGCGMERYRHGDMADLRNRLAASDAAEKIIVTDTVFSMDGDCAPLSDICELAGEHGALVMVDEAHATGLFGKNGSGLVQELGCSRAVGIRMGTLSKAIAGQGGFFAGSALLRDYLVNHARSLVYSTGLPHAILAWDLAAVRYLRKHPELGAELRRVADTFRSKLHDLGFNTLQSTTQIVPLVVGDSAQALKLSSLMREQGIIAPAIRPPTVPKATARVRCSLSSAFSPDHEKRVIEILSKWKSRNG